MTTTTDTRISSRQNDWKELTTSTGGGPSHILFQITSTKEDSRPIQSNETILINLTGRQADNAQHHDGPIFQQAKSWLITVGEPFVWIRPLEWLVEQVPTKEKETALLYIDASSPHHPFQQTTRMYKDYTLPVNSNLLYELQIIQIVMDTSRLNPYFPIQKALTFKSIANDLYQNEWERVNANDTNNCSRNNKPESGKNSRERAIYLYDKGAKLATTLLAGTYFANVEADHPQRKQCESIRMDCHNNTIAVYLRAKRWAKAREAARQALPTQNPKTHLRNVKAHVLDPDVNVEETELALNKAESVICYKDVEEKELKQLRAKWNKKKNQAQTEQ